MTNGSHSIRYNSDRRVTDTLGTISLHPVQGKITPNLHPNILRKFKSINTLEQKVVVGVFWHADSRCDLQIVQHLLIHRFSWDLRKMLL